MVGYGVALAAQRVVVGQQAARVLIFAAAAALQQVVLVGLLRSMVGANAPLPSWGSVIGKVLTTALLGAALIAGVARPHAVELLAAAARRGCCASGEGDRHRSWLSLLHNHRA